MYMQQLLVGAHGSCANQMGAYVSRRLADPMLARLAILNPGRRLWASAYVSTPPTGCRRSMLGEWGSYSRGLCEMHASLHVVAPTVLHAVVVWHAAWPLLLTTVRHSCTRYHGSMVPGG